MMQALSPAGHAWQHQLYDDFSMMQQLADHGDPVKSVPHPAEDPHAASAFFAGAAEGWTQAVQRFAAHLRRRHVVALLQSEPVPEQAYEGAVQYMCALCPSGSEKAFHSRNALLSHQHRKHAVQSPLRRYVFGTIVYMLPQGVLES